MDKSEIKKKFHELIDEMEDENALSVLYEDAVEYKAMQSTDEDLTDEQLALLEKARQQVKSGQFYTHEEVMANLKRCSNTK